MAEYTITHDEEVKGWTSFHSYIPGWMGSLNGEFYSVKDGQLHVHHDESNPIRNNFYGVQYPTKVKAIVNDHPSEIKIAKTIKLEANKPFDVNIKSYINDEDNSITETTLSTTDFLDKEGLQHAFFRRNELVGDLSAKNAYGLGKVKGVVGSVITLGTVTAEINVPLGSIAIGDSLYDINNTLIGTIEDYSGATITVDTTPVIPADTFLFGYKNPRIEGSQIRGYNFEVELTDNTDTRTELFAMNVGITKSQPS